MKLGPNAQAALDQVVERFEAGDLSPIVEYARIQRTGGAIPSDKWTLSNRILAYCQTGSWDCRGYRQWEQAGRYVKRGAKAAFIFGPVLLPHRDPETGEEIPVLTGFKSIAVFPDSATDGQALEGGCCVPRELPPLVDVAKRLGVEVNWKHLGADRWGDCTVDGKNINLGTHDVSVFFHELAHAAHAKIDGKLKGGQDAHQETVAEFTAAVLMHLYGLGDRTGNCWRYISWYAQDPLQAISKALSKIEQVLALLLADQPDVCSYADSPETW